MVPTYSEERLDEPDVLSARQIRKNSVFSAVLEGSSERYLFVANNVGAITSITFPGRVGIDVYVSLGRTLELDRTYKDVRYIKHLTGIPE